jgi:predicted HicB family RNase H-like nuclease
MTDQRQEVFQCACQLFEQGPDWVTFFREVLGVDGIVRRLYKDPDTLAQFEQSEEFQKIQQMLAKLREREKSTDLSSNGTGREPTRVITVRMPKSLHESLKAEANDMRTSMNKLCISKLLQVVDDELVPSELVIAGAIAD